MNALSHAHISVYKAATLTVVENQATYFTMESELSS